MKKFNILFSAALCACALSFSSCSKDDGTETDGLTSSQQSFLTSYVEDIVVSRYSELATNGKALLTAAEAIKSSTASDKTTLIATAATAWETARISWERTEAYLFGPVDWAGIDPGIDSWPLVLPDLQDKIQSWSESDNYLAADGGDLKGFHAIEYMLFADGDAKTVSISNFDSEYAVSQGSLTDAQFEDNLESYLVAICTELYRCVLQLEAEWDLAGLSTTKLTDYNAYGSQITLTVAGGNYGDIFSSPSLDNAYYSSFNACISEALQGAIGIVDEVANVKIADPINAELASAGAGLLEVESWFSHNSVSDFTNNIRGVKEAYMGELCTSESTFDTDTTPATYSLGYFHAKADAVAAAATVAALNAAIAAVKAMPTPFRDNLTWGTANTAAVTAIGLVQEYLEDAHVVLTGEDVPEGEDE